MTAEVAILNKTAVALAADSAVSIGRPPNLKIYNTVNKIFEMSACDPVGIMVYVRLDFMGLPLETIIKEYRKTIKKDAFDTLEQYKDNFCKYLKTEVRVTSEYEIENAYTIIMDFFGRANAEIEDLILDDIMARGSFKKSKINTIIQTYVREKISELKSLEFSDGFKKKTTPAIFSGAIEQLIDACFQSKPNETSKKLLRDYAGCCLSKRVLSDYRSGIVVAGFGAKELCPTLVSFEMDGIIDGRLKLIPRDFVDIGRSGPHAEILGFAQDDMMKSFVNGVDPLISNYFYKSTWEAIQETADLILHAVLKDDAAAGSALSRIQPNLRKITDDISARADEYIKIKCADQVKDMIRSMPKQELATLASSLIEITSLKRKVTRTQETVGGEVDVAIISKSEGFVWTKRKHYFPAELNRRFFVRHFGAA